MTKKDDILKTSQELFLKKGIEPLTVTEIVEIAGVSKATFYKYFANKKDLLRHVCKKIFTEITSELEEILQEGKNNRLNKEKFLELFDFNKYDDLLQTDFVKELKDNYPDLLELYNEWVYEIRLPIYREIMRMAKIDGIVRMDIDLDILIQYSLSLRKAIKYTLENNPEILDEKGYKKITEQFYDLYLNGVVSQD